MTEEEREIIVEAIKYQVRDVGLKIGCENKWKQKRLDLLESLSLPHVIGSCEWIYDAIYDYWETTCDNQYTIIEGTPVDNGMEYCPICGRKLVRN